MRVPGRLVYDPAGNPIKITNPDGFAITFQYDEANRAIRAVDQEGNQVFTHRDVDGRPKCSKDPNGNSVFYTYWDHTRDSKLRRVTAPSANACPGAAPTTNVRAIEYDYDANGNVIQTTQIGSDGATRTSFTSFDALNRPLQSIDPTYTDAAAAIIRPVTQTTYNLLGVLTQVQAGQCTSAVTGCAVAAVLTNQMTYLFDDFGRKLRETDALAKVTSFLYDINNNVTQVTDAKAQITSFTWSYGHLMATRTNLAAGNVNLTYNNLGQVSQALTKVAGSTTTNLIQYDYTYDAFHRLDTLKDTRNAVVVDTLNYDFSPGGLLNKVSDGKANQTNYLYDATGRLSGIWAPNYGTVSYRYDAGGRLKEKWLPNGVNSRYAYFTDNTLAQVVNRSLTASIISQHDYSYDVYANRRQQISNIGGTALTHTYSFDALDRLLTVKQTVPLDATKDETYTYDPLNNLKTRAIGTPVTATTVNVHDAANQLLEARSGTVAGALLAGYVYDANGSLTKKCVGGTVTRTAIDCTATGGATTSLTYDTLDRMTQAVAGATTESYAYDQEGKRIRKVSGATTTNFHYMGPDIYAEYGTTFTAQNAITTHGPNWDDPILRQTGTGPTAIAKFYHQDGLGSVVAVSTATGTTDGTQRFDAWGNKTTVTGAAVATYGYTGREPDASGLTYYRARYYDPASRRFTQRDPIGFGGGDVNLYAYVGNNPTNFTDPDGATPLHAAAGLVGGGVGLLFQAGSDLVQGKLSSFADYAGAAVGGVAGGVAAVTCGPACAGTIAGAAGNLTTQAIRGNGFSGTSLAVDMAMGAAGGKIVGALLPPMAKAHLTNQTKGAIGEGLSKIGLTATGQQVTGRNVPNGFGKSNFDFKLANGKFVESKFGTSKPQGKQLEAVKAYGDRVDVHSWSYPTVSGIAASGPVAALGFGSDAASYFSDLIGMGGVGGQTMSGISPRY